MLQLICILLLNLTFAVLLKDSPAAKFGMLLITIVLFWYVIFSWPPVTTPTSTRSTYFKEDSTAELLKLIAEVENQTK